MAVSTAALPPEVAAGSKPVVRTVMVAARQRAQDRQHSANQALAGRALEQHVNAEPEALQFLQTTAARLGWSARSTHRALRVARTIADLAEAPAVGVGHLAEAVQYRRVLRQPG